MVESRFAKGTWRLNAQGIQLLKQALSNQGLDRCSITMVANFVSQDRRTISKILARQFSGNRSTLETLFERLQCDRFDPDLHCEYLKARIETDIEKVLPLLQTIDPQLRSRLDVAYRTCCPDGYDRPFPKTVEELLINLADLPIGAAKCKPLWQFVGRLVQDSSLPESLRDQLRQVGATELSPESLPLLKLSFQVMAEVILMIWVQPRRQLPGRYSVITCMMSDPDPGNPEAETSLTPLTLSPPRATYLPEELSALLPQWIEACCDRSVALSDLTVQWFLPLELIDQAVDQWKIKLTHREQPSGTECRVMVRFLERQTPRYLKKHDWRKRWHQLMASRQERCIDVLASGGGNIYQLCVDVVRSEFLGCRFVMPADPQQRKNMLEEICDSAVPVGIWVRHPLPGQDIETAMKAVVNGCIGDLPQLLKRLRYEHRIRALDSSITEAAIAAHLSLLWDNPFRLFPQIDYEST